MRTRSKLLLTSASPERMDLKPSTGAELVAAIRKSGLVGMWADRDDIRGSREFARKLRKQASNTKDRASVIAINRSRSVHFAGQCKSGQLVS